MRDAVAAEQMQLLLQVVATAWRCRAHPGRSRSARPCAAAPPARHRCSHSRTPRPSRRCRCRSRPAPAGCCWSSRCAGRRPGRLPPKVNGTLTECCRCARSSFDLPFVRMSASSRSACARSASRLEVKRGSPARRQRQQVRARGCGGSGGGTVSLFRHLDLGQGEIGPAVVGLEEIDVPVEAAVGPRVARLLQRLAALRPQPLEIDGADVGLDLDHLAVDRPLVGEDVARSLPPASIERMRMPGRRRDRPGAGSCASRPASRQAAPRASPSSFEDKLAFVFDRHARIAPWPPRPSTTCRRPPSFSTGRSCAATSSA